MHIEWVSFQNPGSAPQLEEIFNIPQAQPISLEKALQKGYGVGVYHTLTERATVGPAFVNAGFDAMVF